MKQITVIQEMTVFFETKKDISDLFNIVFSCPEMNFYEFSNIITFFLKYYLPNIFTKSKHNSKNLIWLLIWLNIKITNIPLR